MMLCLTPTVAFCMNILAILNRQTSCSEQNNTTNLSSTVTSSPRGSASLFGQKEWLVLTIPLQNGYKESTITETSFKVTQSNVSNSQSTLEEKKGTTKPTMVKEEANVTQTNGELASPSTVSKGGGESTTVVQPSALGSSTTAQAFLQSGIKIAAEDGHFIIYVIVGSLLLSLMYIVYHNKNKKFGSRRTSWPNTCEYQRLDQNLSEVITSLKKKTNIKLL
ncbi:keratinocyte-associated transmembrane protein 2-like [Narcine bancroftii]|uniref:keratinocyte-associated transmembrane protein 2-like n=1 Tax=Narcine bancroftii TaxID=1343680 RepID=UPI003831DAA1